MIPIERLTVGGGALACFRLVGDGVILEANQKVDGERFQRVGSPIRIAKLYFADDADLAADKAPKAGPARASWRVVRTQRPDSPEVRHCRIMLG